MNKKNLVVFSISALVVALAVPLLAQSMRLTANIPFEFVVAGKTLPAGDYWINTSASQVVLQNPTEHASAMSIGTTEYVNGGKPEANTKLVFHKYGEKYFLSEVWDGYVWGGMRLPVSRVERELTKTASAPAPETVTVMASLR